MADFLWPTKRLIVETDGAETHDTPTARRADARRDHALTSLGYRVLRIPSAELTRRPEAIADAIRQSSLARTRR
jgi:very-short-patch-repair endonuclease